MSFPLALHEPRSDIPAYLEASGIKDVTLKEIGEKIASPDVKGAFEAIMADALGRRTRTHSTYTAQHYRSFTLTILVTM